MASSSKSKGKFSVPFEIESGKTYYLGRFVAHSIPDPRKVLAIPLVGYFVYDHNKAKDLEVASLKYPELNIESIYSIELEGNAHPYIYREMLKEPSVDFESWELHEF
ncbi:hypothetical protein [Pleionea sp. CnH1-48]|uniref:hypothetical protein n=1 Tax=Pleionea sp. CnH1-48 TaxID=2954494 RepID=UPI002097E7C0|nr:hypothetical protein [Pleionea sp. CnH1-48]MCO7226450.1 hypothetical protein [Pleionea sp. CnH1-48]